MFINSNVDARVTQNICLNIFTGVGARSKYGVGVGQLQNAVGSPNVASIHIGHSDGCLIGAAIKCDAASAGEVGKHFQPILIYIILLPYNAF